MNKKVLAINLYVRKTKKKYKCVTEKLNLKKKYFKYIDVKKKW